MITLIDLQYDETIDTLKDALKNNKLDDLYAFEYEDNDDPQKIVLNYVTDQAFEVEVLDWPLYLVFPTGDIKAYTYKIIDYNNLIYEITEIKLPIGW